MHLLKMIDGPAAGKEVQSHDLPPVFYVPAPAPRVYVSNEERNPDVRILKYEYHRSHLWNRNKEMGRGFWPYYYERTI